jgi:hypothetical protein
MSEKISLRSNFLGFKEASDFLARETSKSLRDQIQNSDADIFLFEVAGDFTTNHVRLENTIFPDFRSPVFGPEWTNISFEGIPELKNTEIISPDTDEYWNLWKICFYDFYQQFLHKHIEDGRKIFFLARYLCEFILENGALRPHDQLLSLRKRNEKLRDIYEFLQNFPGIHNLYYPDSLLYTSSSSPWEFHPDKEAYIHSCHKLLTVLAPQTPHPGKFLADQLANAALERSQLDSERNAANAAKEQATQELQAAHALIHDLQTRADLAASDRDMANAAREHTTQELQAAHALIHELQTRVDLAASERDMANAAREHTTQELQASREQIEKLQAHTAIDRAEIASLRTELIAYVSLPSLKVSNGEAQNRLASLYSPFSDDLKIKRHLNILQSIGFDQTYYLEHNPDVAKAGVQPIVHYARHGRREGRRARFIQSHMTQKP